MAFNADFTRTVPYATLLGCVFTGDLETLAAAQVNVTYDSRVQAWTGGPAIMQSMSSVTPLAVANDISGDLGRLQFDLAEWIPLEEATLSVPLENSALYPFENVVHVEPTTIVVLRKGTGTAIVSTTVAGEYKPISGQAWGAELSASWARIASVEGKGGDAYACPNTVVITSVGPGPIPTGTEIRIVMDGNLIKHARPATVETLGARRSQLWRFRPSRNSAQAGGAFIIDEAIPAGTTVRVSLEFEHNTVRRITDSITFGRVSLFGPTHAQPMQRSTGLESATSVSPTGFPLVADAVVGSI